MFIFQKKKNSDVYDKGQWVFMIKIKRIMFPYQFLSISTTLKTKSTSDVPAQNSKIFKIHDKTYIVVWSQKCSLTMGRGKKKSKLSHRGKKNQNSHNEEIKIVFNKSNLRANSITLTITKVTLAVLNYPWAGR
jgi:predicted nucleic-acid-binding Zn-ribbon protein